MSLTPISFAIVLGRNLFDLSGIPVATVSNIHCFESYLQFDSPFNQYSTVYNFSNFSPPCDSLYSCPVPIRICRSFDLTPQSLTLAEIGNLASCGYNFTTYHIDSCTNSCARDVGELPSHPVICSSSVLCKRCATDRLSTAPVPASGSGSPVHGGSPVLLKTLDVSQLPCSDPYVESPSSGLEDGASVIQSVFLNPEFFAESELSEAFREVAFRLGVNFSGFIDTLIRYCIIFGTSSRFLKVYLLFQKEPYAPLPVVQVLGSQLVNLITSKFTRPIEFNSIMMCLAPRARELIVSSPAFYRDLNPSLHPERASYARELDFDFSTGAARDLVELTYARNVQRNGF